MIIFEDDDIYIEVENSPIPWLKVFTKTKYKELSECSEGVRLKLFDAINIIEKAMIDYYNPTKINIASFGNYVPHVHMHIMARFENDSHFPEPMWGKKQRESTLDLPSFDTFKQIVCYSLDELLN